MSEFTSVAPLRLVPGSRSLDREAVLEPNGDVIRFGMHGGVADHYKATATDPQPSTLDYLVASVGGCLIGTFAGSLLRARVPVVPAEALRGTATGEISSDDDGVLTLKRLVVDYELSVDPAHADAAREVHDAHVARCPNARSVAGAIEIVTNLNVVPA